MAQEQQQQQQSPEGCSLSCRNGGYCDVGEPEYGLSVIIHNQGYMVPFGEQPHSGERGMFCRCPAGFMGLQCEIALKPCSKKSSSSSCHLGQECMEHEDDFGMPFRHCECDVSTSDMTATYARHACHLAYSTFCSEDTTTTTATPSRSYCSNAGKCNQLVGPEDPHEGCQCPPGWEGPHCEFPLKTGSSLIIANSREQAADRSGETWATVIGVIAAVGVGIGLYMLWIRRSPSMKSEVEISERRTAPTTRQMDRKKLGGDEATNSTSINSTSTDGADVRDSSESYGDLSMKPGSVIV